MDSSAFDLNFTDCLPGILTKWKVNEGGYVAKGTVLFTYTLKDSDTPANDQCLRFRSNCDGIVTTLIKSEGELILPKDSVLRMQGCTHPIVLKDMCAECGADLRILKLNKSKTEKTASVAMVHNVPELVVSREQAEMLGKADEARLLKHRMLVLLVDLDQTLIHTTNDDVPPNLKDVYHFQLHGPRSPWYHTRLRPGTCQFLERISKMYEMHICTFGSRLYAHTVANFLDKDGKFFSHRILSRDECFSANSKTANLAALFPCGDSLVCIIDDREDVWNFTSNLIHVKPYHFFLHTGDINAPPGLEKDEEDSTEVMKQEFHPKEDEVVPLAASLKPSSDADEEKPIHEDGDTVRTPTLSCSSSRTEDTNSDCDSKLDDLNSSAHSDASADEKSDLIDPQDEDDYLMYLEDILSTIHKAYYEMLDQMRSEGKPELLDTKHVIPYVKSKILRGCKIVFSGVIPNRTPAEKSQAYIIAVSLGAVVSDALVFSGEERTTHLIATRLGTVKVLEAKKHADKDFHVVSLDWLWCCNERWERVSELLFPLVKDVDVTVKVKKKEKVRVRVVKDKVRVKEIDGGGDAIVYHTYDPVTGKRIGIRPGQTEQPQPDSVSVSDDETEAESFRGSFNPLLAFGSEDLSLMGQEVDDVLSEESNSSSSSSSSDDEEKTKSNTKKDKARKDVDSSDASDDNSLSNDSPPHGWDDEIDVTQSRFKKRKITSPKCDEALSELYDSEVDFENKDEVTRDNFVRAVFPRDSDKSSDSSNSSFNESVGSVDEEMAAAVEREFLS